MKSFCFEKSIGIDFQKDLIVMILIGRTLRGMVLLDYHIWRNRSNGLEEKEIDQQFLENLRNFVAKNKLSNIRGSFCFPRHDIILKYIDIPAPKKEDVKNILEYEIEKHVPINKKDIYYDFQIIKQKENIHNILIAVARKSKVNHYMDILKEASIIPSIISLSTASNFNLLSFNEFNKKAINTIIEIGLKSVNISFIIEGSVNFTRSVPIPENQNWLKCLREYTDSYIELETTSESFTEFLIREINLSLAGCREISSMQAIDYFYLSGGGSLAIPIKEHLEQRITGTVYILDSLRKLRAGNISEEERNFLANAIGMGIQNHIKKTFSINFIPDSLRKYAQDNSLKAMLVLSGILLLMIFVVGFSSILKDNLTLNKIEKELKKIKHEVIIAENLEREYNQINKQKLILQQIQANNPSRLRILKELTTLLPLDVWLTSIIIKQEATDISGTASSTSNLIPLLEQSEIFTDAHFIDSIQHVKNREQFKIKLPINKVSVK